MKRADFSATYPFTLDQFQVEAIDALDSGHSVLVAAPTGAGKTVVADYAVAKTLDEGSPGSNGRDRGAKIFYTTPIKALSNQKYGDFVKRYGAGDVGLLTGDNAINGDAPVVVMTTEVLRNMIYASSPTLEGLRYVVLDEVHYLQDTYRGPVWEEVIIHAPPEVDLVCLSATVSNAEEFADWIQTVRGATSVVISEHRPVELRHLYMVGDRRSDQLHLLPTFVDGKPNAEASQLDSRAAHEANWRGRGRPSGRSALHTPRRAEVVERLAAERMLPAIYFIFSRAACDDAVGQCRDAGLRLTAADERAAIRRIVEERTDVLSDDDLHALDYGRWSAGLEAGFAAHHAGMVPVFKEAVEACFAAGLVKAVFATETLALGINMPARTVVIEKLSKFTGERHEFLRPGEYTQLTGRAGRRGIDTLGNAVVLWSPFVPFDQVASLASARTYALTSSFRPTYNMAANLVRRYPADAAHHLLNLSFAQYRADRDVVRLESQLDKLARVLDKARAEATCERGDVDDYRARLKAATAAMGSQRGRMEEALGRIRPGDVLLLAGGKSGGRVAVVSTSHRRGGEVRLGALGPDRRYLTLSARDFADLPDTVGHIDLPTPYAPRSPAFQREVSRALGRMKPPPARRARRGPAVADDGGAESHPVAACPDAARHVRAAERAERVGKDVRRLEQRIQGRSESLARQFDRVLRVLETWGYVEGWALTEAGQQLVRLYHESDLLVAEALRAGVLDGLDAPTVAALASGFTYESRGPARDRGGERGAEPQVWFPSSIARHRWADLERLAREINRAEEDGGLPPTRKPDPGFVGAAYAWASGQDLGEVIAEEELSGGDFVRNVKQLIDLLRQIGDVAPDPETASAARTAADGLFRGVVAASSVVGS